MPLALKFARARLRQAGEVIDPIGGFVRCASVPELAGVWGNALAPRFGLGKSDHTEIIPHGGKAGGCVDQFHGNGIANIAADKEIRPADTDWPTHVLRVHVEQSIEETATPRST